MWLLFGVGAIIFAIINIICFLYNKETKWYRFVSLSLTTLTVTAFYQEAAQWVSAGRLGDLQDVVPAVSPVLMFLVVCSICINSITLFK